MAGLANTCAMWDQMKTKGMYRGMSPYYITQALPNSCSGNVSIRHKLQGPNVRIEQMGRLNSILRRRLAVQ